MVKVTESFQEAFDYIFVEFLKTYILITDTQENARLSVNKNDSKRLLSFIMNNVQESQ